MICNFLAENRYIQTGSRRKQPPQADSQEKRKQTQVQPLCPVRPVKKTKFSLPVSPWCSVLLIVASLVCLAGGPFWPLSSPNPPKRTSPAWSAWLAPSGGPFWPLSSPNPPKRTLPAWSAWLCSVLSLGGPFCPNPPKRTSPCWSAWLSSLLSLMVVRFGRSAAQILQNGPRQLGLLGCAPCSSSGGPFWPLSSPNPSTRTSPALPTSSVSVPFSPWCFVLST